MIFRLLLSSFLLLVPVYVAQASPCAILLHGLGRSAASMSKIEDVLLDAGFRVWNKSYPSTSANVSSLAKGAIDPAVEFCGGLEQSNFVTHSLGGILVRSYLQNRPYSGRIVMIAPPNKGSEIPDVLREIDLFSALLGPAAMQLGTDRESKPNQLKPIDGEIGIIAGDSTSDPWFSWLIPGPDDGKVAVASTRLKEMQDFLLVSRGHTFIMRNDEVIRQVRHFLLNGRFLSEMAD